MPGIAFTHIAMLAGLVALAVPVLIHLLLRRKKKRVRFSTIQFFLQQDEQSAQRRRLRNWLLLSLRLLICALLVLAFARPYLQNGGANGTVQRRVVLVIDRSLSLQANAVDGPNWLRAREAARQILSELKPDDRAALVSCGARAEVLCEWAPPAAVSRVVADLQPTCATGSLGEGLQQARRLLSLADSGTAATVCVISDLQQSSCATIASAPIPKSAELKVIKIGDLVTPNLAISDLQVRSKDGISPHVGLVSYSDEEARDVQLNVTVDGQVAFSRTVTLAPNARTNVDLTVPLGKPGWHDIAARLQSRDALGLDNARFATAFVPMPARVLVAETRSTPRAFEQESFFIAAALDPGRNSTNSIQSRFAVESLSPDELTRRLAEPTAAQLPCEVAILPGLKQIPGALANALTTYLQNGGGALLFVGDGVGANRYNAEFRSVLPAQLGQIESSPDWESAWRIGEHRTNIAMFAPFQAERSGDLSLARFTKRFSLSPAEATSVAARFEDGTPFLLAQTVGHGRVVLVNTSADTAWNDWPKHKTFVPWLHGTAQYLLPSTKGNTLPSELALAAGADAELDLGTSAANTAFKLRGPDGKEQVVTADTQGQIHDVTFAAPGVYSLWDGAGQELRRIAVNISPSESDLSSMSANDFQQQIARAPEEPKTTLAAGLFGEHGNHRELWRVLLLTVVGLLMVELVVANRTLV